MATDQARVAVDLLIRLHTHKTVGYGDAWRKRGELLSIFTNLARKFDRLVVSLDEGIRSADERLTDTAGDLCVYAGKYLTWLAEQHPEAFNAASKGVTSGMCADNRGPEAMERVLLALPPVAAKDVATCWRRLKAVFQRLDNGLVAQADGGAGARLPWPVKVQLAWAVAAASLALLVALADEEPEGWAAWRAEVEGMG